MGRVVSQKSRLRAWLFPALAGLAPVLGAVAPLGLAPLIGVAALAAGWVLVAEGRWRRVPRGVPALLFALLIALGALSAAWAIDPADTLRRALRPAGMVIAGGLVIAAARETDDAARRRVMIALTAGLLFAALVPLADRLFGIAIGPGTLSRHNRGLSAGMLLIWPASLLLARDRAWGWLAVLWAATAVATFALESESAKLALAAGLVAAGAAWRLPRLAPVLLGVLAVAYIAVAPLVHQKDVLPFDRHIAEKRTAATGWSWLPFSARHRLGIWEFTSRRIADRPLSGWGLGSSRRLPGENIVVDGRALGGSLHPHNAVLQLWVELGAGGAALAAALAIWASVRLRRLLEPAASAAGAGYFAAAFILLCLTFGVWQSWWLAAQFLAAALFAAALSRDG